MRLSNFRIPSAIIGLTIVSSVAVLFPEPFTYAPGAKLVAQEPNQRFPSQLNPCGDLYPNQLEPCGKSRDLKVITTADFEDKHLAKDREEALKKARDRQDGGVLLHYIKKTDLSSLPDALKRRFKKELSEENFKTPTPDIIPNNYWTGLNVTVWEYDKGKDKINERTVELCLGLVEFRVNKDNKVEVGVHHLHAVRPPK